MNTVDRFRPLSVFIFHERLERVQAAVKKPGGCWLSFVLVQTRKNRDELRKNRGAPVLSQTCLIIGRWV